jgi:hypothetical protein
MLRLLNNDLSDYYQLDGSNANGYYYFDSDSYFKVNGDTLELWVHGTLRQTWTTSSAPPVPPVIVDGSYIGFGGLTYQL